MGKNIEILKAFLMNEFGLDDEDFEYHIFTDLGMGFVSSCYDDRSVFVYKINTKGDISLVLDSHEIE